jgi:hypothetical protein
MDELASEADEPAIDHEPAPGRHIVQFLVDRPTTTTKRDMPRAHRSRVVGGKSIRLIPMYGQENLSSTVASPSPCEY